MALGIFPMMDQLALSMIRLLENTPVISLIDAVFLLYIGVQVLVLLLCIVLITCKGALKDLFQFMREYWRPCHLRHNLLTLSLWLSTCLAYLTLWSVSTQISALTLTEGFEKSPLLSLYIYAALGGFLLYILYKSNRLLVTTLEVSQGLKKMRSYHSFKRVLQKIRDSRMLGRWGSAATSVTYWISERLLRSLIEMRMRKDFRYFCLSVSGEYLLLASIVAASILIT